MDFVFFLDIIERMVISPILPVNIMIINMIFDIVGKFLFTIPLLVPTVPNADVISNTIFENFSL